MLWENIDLLSSALRANPPPRKFVRVQRMANPVVLKALSLELKVLIDASLYLCVHVGSRFNRCFVRFCFHFCWIWVQLLIDASFDFVFISAGFGFRTCSIFGVFWLQFGTILVPCWVHFGSVWGPFCIHLGSLGGFCGGKASE